VVEEVGETPTLGRHDVVATRAPRTSEGCGEQDFVAHGASGKRIELGAVDRRRSRIGTAGDVGEVGEVRGEIVGDEPLGELEALQLAGVASKGSEKLTPGPECARLFVGIGETEAWP
jgi:hypothetical protein